MNEEMPLLAIDQGPEADAGTAAHAVRKEDWLATDAVLHKMTKTENLGRVGSGVVVEDNTNNVFVCLEVSCLGRRNQWGLGEWNETLARVAVIIPPVNPFSPMLFGDVSTEICVAKTSLFRETGDRADSAQKAGDERHGED